MDVSVPLATIFHMSDHQGGFGNTGVIWTCSLECSNVGQTILGSVPPANAGGQDTDVHGNQHDWREKTTPWNLKMMVWTMIFLFQGCILRFQRLIFRGV